MKQPAINSLFQASKHYSQSHTQDKDYIVATPASDAKPLAAGTDKKVISLALGKKTAKKPVRAQPATSEKPLTPTAVTKVSKDSQKTAASTK